MGGSDSHDAATPYRQNNFFGAHGINDGEIKVRMSGRVFAGMDLRYENPAGLTGIWAEENTRASLLDGMQRKETFATSGPHIKIRLLRRLELRAGHREAEELAGHRLREGGSDGRRLAGRGRQERRPLSCGR